MVKDKKLVTDNLSNEEKDTLQTLLTLIIPSSEDGKMPSAADVGFINYLDNNSNEKTHDSIIKLDCHVYALSYNILKIASGMGGLLYIN